MICRLVGNFCGVILTALSCSVHFLASVSVTLLSIFLPILRECGHAQLASRPRLPIPLVTAVGGGAQAWMLRSPTMPGCGRTGFEDQAYQ